MSGEDAFAEAMRLGGMGEGTALFYEAIARSDQFTAAGAYKAFGHLAPKEQSEEALRELSRLSREMGEEP